MLKSILTLTHNHVEYNVVMDVVTTHEQLSENESVFVSGAVDLGDIKHYFNNDLSNTMVVNPVGFWQVILTNYEFDYSQEFSYKFVISEKEYVISFSLNTGIKAYHNIGITDDDDVALIEIDFNKFSKFEFVQTQLQKDEIRTNTIKKITYKHLMVYAVLALSLLAYYQYVKIDFNQSTAKFSELKQESDNLLTQINQKYTNQLELNTKYQDVHIKRLFALINDNVVITKSEIDLSTDTAALEIDFDDIPKVRRIAVNNTFNLSIDGDFEQDKAIVTWKIK